MSDSVLGPARARLICETDSCAPGVPLQVAVTFAIDEGWHLYWNGRNDTGFAPSIQWNLPEGFRAQSPQWPTPKRHVVPEGSVLDHIYEKSLTLLVAIEVPADLGGLTSVDIGADLEWLVCQEACLPGDASLSLKIPVVESGATPAKSKDADTIKRAREQLPKPFKPGGKDLIFGIINDKLTITSTIAQSMTYYPATTSTPLADPIRDAESRVGSMSMKFESGAAADARIAGILEVVRRDRTRESYALDATVKELVGGRR